MIRAQIVDNKSLWGFFQGKLKILPGTKLASMLAPGSFGVVMKYIGKLQSRADGDIRMDKYQPISLSVRLLNGSWLN